MTNRRAWTTDELREMGRQIGKPPYPPHLVDELKAALLYAADVIDAANVAVSEYSLPKPQEV